MSFVTRLMNRIKGKPPFCSAVIAAAGFSKRMDGKDKLYIEISGAPVLVHTLLAFQHSSLISEIIVVVRSSEFEHIIELCKQFRIDKAAKIIAGGPTRLESVMNGVFSVSNKAKIIAIHDGARPCIDDEVIGRAVTAAAKYHAVAPAVPVSATLKKARNGIVSETVDRTDLYEIQTPQVFTTEIIKAALTNAADKSIEITDDCMAAELIDVPIYITEGSCNNIKITTYGDEIIAESILDRRKAQGAKGK